MTIKFFYLRTDNANTRRQEQADKGGYLQLSTYHRGDPVACVAYELIRGNGYARFAVATANQEHDQFSKPTARALAAGRLVLGDAAVAPVNELQTKNADFVYQILKALAASKSKEYPSTVKKAAKRGLRLRNGARS